MYSTLIGFSIIILSLSGVNAADITIDDLLIPHPTIYEEIHFNQGGNDNNGIIRYENALANAQTVTIGSATISCNKQIHGRYYSNTRGLKLRPLSNSALVYLQNQDTSYSGLTLNGGRYTNCSGAPDISYVYGQIIYSDNTTLIVGVATNIDDLILPLTQADTFQFYDGQGFSGLVYDSVAGVGQMSASITIPDDTSFSTSGGSGGGWSINTSTTNTATTITPEIPTNESIINDYCYTRNVGFDITLSDTIILSEESLHALAFLYSYELTKYNNVDAFEPGNYLTREQAAKMFSNFAMHILCRKPDLTLHTKYSDTENADPSLIPYIELAYQLGLMKGGPDDTFRPFDHISKAEANAVLIRMILAEYLPEETDPRYQNYNYVATELSIIRYGADDSPVLREYIALMLLRAYQNQQYALWTINNNEAFALSNKDDY